MSRLLNDLTKKCHMRFYCPYCLHRYSRKELLDAHIDDCKKHEAQKIQMPEEKWLKFDKFQYQIPVPYVVYADMESVLTKHSTCLPDPSKSSTTPITNHVPSGYCYTIIGNFLYIFLFT